jgi:hypothetical protein
VMGVTTRTVAMGEESSGGTREKTNQTGTLCNGWQRWVISTQLHKLLENRRLQSTLEVLRGIGVGS